MEGGRVSNGGVKGRGQYLGNSEPHMLSTGQQNAQPQVLGITGDSQSQASMNKNY